jgi:PAS domain S-box-containing protein
MDACIETDDNGLIKDVNQAVAALLQSRREFLIGKPLGLFVTEGFRAAFYEWLARQRHLDRPTVFETRLRRGRLPPAEVVVTVSAEPWNGEEPGGLRWVLRDVSEVRRVEQALMAERQLLDSVIDAAQAIIIVLDAGGRVVRSNPYLHAVSGYGPRELYGRDWADVLLYPEQRPALRQLVLQATTRGLVKSDVVPLRTRSGPPREVVWSARGLPEGVAGAAVLIGHDVTELQDAQRQSLQAERLAAIGQIAAGLAHESRNALQRIQACLTMLALRARGNPEALDLIDRAQKAQDDLHHLLDDVRSYAASLEPHPVATDLAAVWREAWDDVVALQGSDPADLCEDLEGTDVVCDIDPFHFKRVFRNIFENALAVGADRVEVTARRLPGALEALEVRVRDNGPGFTPPVLSRLFEPFLTTKTHGTGLGLAICRRIVEAHGGTIEAGAGGPGAEIRITLPRRMP